MMRWGWRSWFDECLPKREGRREGELIDLFRCNPASSRSLASTRPSTITSVAHRTPFPSSFRSLSFSPSLLQNGELCFDG